MSSGTWDSREAAAEWQSVAATRRQFFAPATERMLDLATIPVGGRVLDIGAGSGDSSIAAARRVGPTGSVLATDISATMLGQAATAARHEGLSNIETRVMDAQQLLLDSNSVDVVISRFALMLIPDIHKALTEIRRVLRDGGTVAALVFSRCPYLSLPHAIARRVGRLTSPPEPFGEFRLAGPNVMRDAYVAAGLRNVVVHEVSARRSFDSLAAAMAYMKDSPLPLRELTSQLSPPQLAETWSEIEHELEPFVRPEGYESPCDLLIGTGCK